MTLRKKPGSLDGGLQYGGIAIADGAKPDKGSVGIVHCGGSDDLAQPVAFSELGNWKVATKGDKGTLAGVR